MSRLLKRQHWAHVVVCLCEHCGCNHLLDCRHATMRTGTLRHNGTYSRWRFGTTRHCDADESLSVVQMRDWKSLEWGKSARLVEILSRSGECEERRQLLEEASERDSHGRTLLHWAAKTRQVALLQALLLALPCNARKWPDNRGRTPFMVCMKQRGSSRSVRAIIVSLGSSDLCSDVPDVNGKTALHYIAEKTRGVKAAQAICECLEGLLNSKKLSATLDATDNEGNTAFHALALRKECQKALYYPFSETALTVLARFFTQKFPTALQSANKNGESPLAALASKSYRDALIAVIEVAPPAALLWRDSAGMTFLSYVRKALEAAVRPNPMEEHVRLCKLVFMESVVKAIPVDVLVKFDKEELLGHGRLAKSPLMAALRCHERFMAIVQLLGDQLEESTNEWALLCTQAARCSIFRPIAHLMKAGVSSCLDYVGSGYLLKSALTELCSACFWREEELDAAMEILEAAPVALFTARATYSHTICNVVFGNMPLELTEIVLSRLPNDYFSDTTVEFLTTHASEEKLDLLLQTILPTAFDAPFVIRGLLARREGTVTPDLFQSVLEHCSDEAFNPRHTIGAGETLLHTAALSCHWETFLPLLVARAPHLRQCLNSRGQTVTEAVQARALFANRSDKVSLICG